MGKKFDKLKDCIREIDQLRHELTKAIEAGADIEMEWQNTGLVEKPRSLLDRLPPDYHFNGSQVFTFRINPYK